MVRRALLSLVPIALAALALLPGTPGTRAGKSDAQAAGVVVSPAFGVLSAAVVRGSLTEDIPDIAVSQGADADDNSSALIVPVAVAVLWPEIGVRAAHS